MFPVRSACRRTMRWHNVRTRRLTGSRSDGGASVCFAEGPHLRTSAVPAAWTQRSADRDQPGGYGLQPEAHAACAGRNPVAGRSGILTIAVHSSNHKEAMSPLQNIASSYFLVRRFVTDWKPSGNTVLSVYYRFPWDRY